MANSKSVRTRGLFLGFIIAFTITGWILLWTGKATYELAEQVRYLEPRNFEELTLIIVGSGGTTENPTRRGPTIAIGHAREVLLIDAGRAVAEGLRNAEIPVQQPRTVYLTSLLAENTVGIDDLLLTGWRAPRTAPLRLVGPPGTRDLARGLLAAHRIDIANEGRFLGYPEAGAQLEVVEIDSDWSEERDGMRVQALTLRDGPYAAIAYRFDDTDTSIVVSSAAWDREAFIEFARGVRILCLPGYSEGSLASAIAAPEITEPERKQLQREAEALPTLAQAGAIAARAGVYKLVLVRLRPPPIFERPLLQEVRQSFNGILVLGQDGEEITAASGT